MNLQVRNLLLKQVRVYHCGLVPKVVFTFCESFSKVFPSKIFKLFVLRGRDAVPKPTIKHEELRNYFGFP